MPYDPTFIPGETIPLPVLASDLSAHAHDGGAPIDHSRFSIVMHATRGLAIYTAHQIDGASLLAEGVIERIDRFRFDPQAPHSIQTDDDRGYFDNDWDRGHLVRRRSVHWGDLDAATTADRESFFWTNIAPQHRTLHQRAWGRIEDWMLEFAHGGDRRAAVFTGPVLSPNDPAITNKPGESPLQIPAGFWKIVVLKPQDEVRAAGFLVWQRDFDKRTPAEFVPYLEQVRITTLEFITGLDFGGIRDADPLRFGDDAATPAGAPAPGGGSQSGLAPPIARSTSGPALRSTAVRTPQDIFI